MVFRYSGLAMGTKSYSRSILFIFFGVSEFLLRAFTIFFKMWGKLLLEAGQAAKLLHVIFVIQNIE